MSLSSHIEWTDATWNPVTGCTKVSPGCKYCYAERFAKRLKSMGKRRYINGFQLTLQPDLLTLPLTWAKPRRVFVNSMSDLFHKEVPLEYIQQVFSTMVRADHHIFQILTKRSERARELAPFLPWPRNVWMGVSIENSDYMHRADDLRVVPAAVRFLSCEPLIGPLSELDLRGIDWVIGGGESGPRYRRLEPEWIQELRDKCLADGVPFFFKQWGGRNKKATGRLLDGVIWDQLPEPCEANKRACMLKELECSESSSLDPTLLDIELVNSVIDV